MIRRDTLFKSLVSVVILTCGLTALAWAGAPSLVSYQGFLVDNGTGEPVTDVSPGKTMTFRLYSTETGGTPIWEETHTDVPVEAGRFTVLLGAGDPPVTLDESQFGGTTRYLGITIGSDTEMDRIRISSTPWSFRVATVNGASGGTVSGDLTVSGTELSLRGPITVGPWAGSLLFEKSALFGSMALGQITVDYNSVTGASPMYMNPLVDENIILATGGGNVGIGTSNPSERLDVIGNVEAVGNLIGRSGLTGHVAYEMEIDAGDGSGLQWLANGNGVPTVVLEAAEGTTGGQITLKNATGTPTIYLDGEYGSGGKGRITTEVLEITGGADFSEQFSISCSPENKIEPGMVMAIDSECPGNLRVADQPYDKRVAGILSGAGGIEPGLMLGQRATMADGDYPVALTGRVYCLVDASFGAVEPGDLLTTSQTPGHAMRVADPTLAQGAILGKAMTSLASGQGLVLVLVTLQ